MPPKPFSFNHQSRLHGRRDFDNVFNFKLRKIQPPLSVWAAPNNLDRLRLGLSVSARVGSAPLRNRIKRLLREAFRLSRRDWPTGLDLVVVVQPHKPATLAYYQKLLANAVSALHTASQKQKK